MLATAALGYAQGGYYVVVDGVVGPWYIGEFRIAAAGTGIPLHYVILRPDEADDAAAARLAAAARTRSPSRGRSWTCTGSSALGEYDVARHRLHRPGRGRHRAAGQGGPGRGPVPAEPVTLYLVRHAMPSTTFRR